ncbi:lysozyme [bacterium]|nr:lysozyme [bacterium]
MRERRSIAEIVNDSFTPVKHSERLEGVKQKTRDDEGKFTFKNGGSVSSGHQSDEEKLKNRADILFTTMKNQKPYKNLNETNPIKRFENSLLENFNQKLYEKSIETAPKWDSSYNAKFSDSELKKARIFIQSAEKFEPKAYFPNENDVLTIGYGHTGLVDGKPITPGMTITKEKAEELFRKDLESHTFPLKNVKVPLTSNQKIALASFLYNLGPGVLKKDSTMLEKLNSGDFKGVVEKMRTYNKQFNKKTGQYEILNGLVNRRAKEIKLFETPDEK